MEEQVVNRQVATTLQSQQIDQPLDFSKKLETKPEIINEDDEAIRKFSRDSGVSITSAAGRESPASRSVSPLSVASEEQPRQLIGEPRVTIPSMNTFMTNTSMANSMGMFYPGAGGFSPAFMPPAFGPLWPNPMAAAAFMQQQQEAARKVLQSAMSQQQNNSKSTTRPFKQYPKDPLNFSLSTFPGIFPSGGSMAPNGMATDPGIIAEAVKSHEQMYNIYKQQVINQRSVDDDKKKPGRSNGGHRSRSNSLQSCSTASLPDPGTPIQSNGNHQNHVNGSRLSVHTPDMEMIDNVASQVKRNGSAAVPTPPLSSPSSGSQHEEVNNQPSAMLLANMSSSNAEISHSPKRKNGVIGISPVDSPNITLSNSSNDSSTVGHVTSTTPPQCDSPMSVSSSGGGRKRPISLPDDQKDNAYWERRRKNNEAAKRSRDTRRAKEDEIAIRAAFLEQENLRLRVELAALRQQTAKLRSELVMFQSPPDQRSAALSPAEGS